MNPRLHIPIAIIISVIIHVILMAWLLPTTPLSLHGNQGILQVTLLQNNDVHARELHSHTVEITVPAIRNLEAKPKPVLKKPIQTPAAVNFPPVNSENSQTSGQLHWQPQPGNQQNQMMIAMQQSKLAHDRELRKISILAGLSNLSLMLRPLIIEKIICLQQAGNEIKCTPSQKEETQTLLKQFLDLAQEAHNLGITDNPVRMDFGPDQGVSVTFLNTH